jgi:outer membrane immunogenic protein
MAADMPVKAQPLVAPAVFSWTGLYIGAHGGFGWGRKEWTEVTLATPRPEGDFNVSGPLAGGQIGYNFQSGQVVFGVEVDGSWANLTGSRLSLAFPAQTIRTEVRSLGSFAGRLGLSWANNLLTYVKLGAGWANDRNSVSGTATASWSDTRWGFMAGGGVEIALTGNWSAKAEYDYMNFGTRRTDGIGCTGACVPPFSEEVRQHLHIVKFGINYRFGGPIVARF